MINLKTKLKELIVEAAKAGLSEADISNANEFLKYNESGLALDTILTQIHEYNISITESFYQKVELIARAMKLPASDYIYIKELIK